MHRKIATYNPTPSPMLPLMYIYHLPNLRFKWLVLGGGGQSLYPSIMKIKGVPPRRREEEIAANYVPTVSHRQGKARQGITVSQVGKPTVTEKRNENERRTLTRLTQGKEVKNESKNTNKASSTTLQSKFSQGELQMTKTTRWMPNNKTAPQNHSQSDQPRHHQRHRTVFKHVESAFLLNDT